MEQTFKSNITKVLNKCIQTQQHIFFLEIFKFLKHVKMENWNKLTF